MKPGNLREVFVQGAKSGVGRRKMRGQTDYSAPPAGSVFLLRPTDKRKE